MFGELNAQAIIEFNSVKVHFKNIIVKFIIKLCSFDPQL